MEVEKINIQGVQPETEQTFQGKKSVQSDIRESHDEEKCNAAKLMTGAAALAGVVAASIIGHKTGAFKKLGKMIRGAASELSKNAEKAADEAAEAVTNAGRKAEETVTEAVKSTNKTAEKVKPAVTETVEQTTAKPVQNNVEKAADASKKVEQTAAKPLQDKTAKASEKAAETLNNPKTLDELAEKALKAGKKTFERERIDQYGQKLLETFDAKTMNKLESKFFFQDGKLGSIDAYDPKTGKKLKRTLFYDDGETIARTVDFDPRRKNTPLKITDFDGDGNISCIKEYSHLSGKVQKVIYPNKGSLEFDRFTGNTLIKVDGKPI